jgi:hypothetical protein
MIRTAYSGCIHLPFTNQLLDCSQFFPAKRLLCLNKQLIAEGGEIRIRGVCGCSRSFCLIQLVILRLNCCSQILVALLICGTQLLRMKPPLIIGDLQIIAG